MSQTLICTYPSLHWCNPAAFGRVLLPLYCLSEMGIRPAAYLPTLAMVMMITIMKKLMDLESVLKIAYT